jgi:hypothetical protein
MPPGASLEMPLTFDVPIGHIGSNRCATTLPEIFAAAADL